MSREPGETLVFGVIGWPLGHSLSPRIHEAGYKALGLKARFVAIPARDGGKALDAARFLGFKGLAVTIPHKVEAARICGRLEGLARRLGAVNTVLFSPGKRPRGWNTDLGGLAAVLKSLKADRKRPALVLGAGGASRAAVLALESRGWNEIRLAARRKARGWAVLSLLRKGTKRKFYGFSLGELRRALDGAGLVVNATPLGMFPRVSESPLPSSLLRRDLAVAETVYNPLETKLLREARRKGAKAAPGWHMFLEQALLQFRLMTGRKAPRRAMQAELLRALGA